MHSSEAVDVPVVANGGIRSLDDAKRCLIETKAQAVMAGSLSLPLSRSFCASSYRHTPSLNRRADDKPGTV